MNRRPRVHARSCDYPLLVEKDHHFCLSLASVSSFGKRGDWKSCSLPSIIFQLQYLMSPRDPDSIPAQDLAPSGLCSEGSHPLLSSPSGICNSVSSLFPDSLSQEEINRFFKRLDHRMMPGPILSTRWLCWGKSYESLSARNVNLAWGFPCSKI